MPILPTTNTTADSLQFIFIIMIGIAIAAAAYRQRRHPVDVPDESVLLTYYTNGALVLPFTEGQINDMHFQATLLTNPTQSAVGGDGNALLFRVELPYRSKIHLICVPKKAGVTQLDPTGSGLMERVQLEGDFGDYFSLFCEHGMQVDARYVLDPMAMDFLVSFCQEYDWELIGSELYFMHASKTAEQSIHPYDDVARFIDQIKPAVKQPLSDAEKQALAPYGEDRRTDLRCPICGQPMANNAGTFTCPAGHGVLVRGGAVAGLIKKPKYSTVSELSTTDQRTKPLICPSCGATMSRVPYNFSKVTIDSCPDCPYRWLDAGEFQPVAA